MQAPAAQQQAAFSEPMHLCPRCGYRGMSAGYFSRGGHVAMLVGLTMVTMPIMGAGGLGFFLLRHNHRVCPRCGMHWGPHALRAMSLVPGGGNQMTMSEPAFPMTGGGKRGWAILMMIVAGLFLTIGLSEGEFPLILMGMMAGGGGAALLRGQKKASERRHDAIIESLQLPVLQLAGRKGGRLTVTDVATEMGWPMVRAEKVLNSLDDGLRVMSDITDDGVIVYDFVEIRTAHLNRGGGTNGAERNVLHA
jgi:ribosomal protein S27AE